MNLHHFRKNDRTKHKILLPKHSWGYFMMSCKSEIGILYSIDMIILALRQAILCSAKIKMGSLLLWRSYQNVLFQWNF